MPTNPISTSNNPGHEQELSIRMPTASSYLSITGITMTNVVAGYPFWAIKMALQMDPIKNNTVFGTTQNIYQEKGLRGFYPGAQYYFLGAICKQLGRIPALEQLPKRFEGLVPEHWESNYGLPNIATGATIATVEAGLFGPLERVIRGSLSSDPAHKLSFNKLSFKFLYTGVGLSLTSNVIVWTTFTGLENMARTKLKAILNTEELTMPQTAAVGAAVGLAMAVALLPLDTIQTCIQTQAQPLTPTHKKPSMLFSYLNHCKDNGGIIKTSFSGVRAVIPLHMLNAITTTVAVKCLRDANDAAQETSPKRKGVSL
jgi:transmembrane carrier protein